MDNLFNLDGIETTLRHGLGIVFLILAIYVGVQIHRKKIGAVLTIVAMGALILVIAAMGGLASSDTAGQNLLSMFVPGLSK